ncbi:ABC transporter ATP-binding protein [bacterium]|nr:MAG: ABC transporter ATP-binding protein [bacterium]
MSIVEIKNLTKRFDEVVAVNGLNLNIESGELFGFLGPNGAGKTTTIKIIVGLLHPDEGSVSIDGFDVVKNPEKAKKHIGYIPDNPYIYDRLTGREFLELVGSLYGMNRKLITERIEWLFELFGIEDWGDDYAAEYSHGMRQKIIMASAIMHDPKLIMIDEPMVGLDPQSQRLVKGVLKKLSERGISIFMSTHTLSVAEELCTRIGIIHKGELLKLGTLEQLRTDAKMGGKSLEELFVKLTGGERKIKLWDE